MIWSQICHGIKKVKSSDVEQQCQGYPGERCGLEASSYDNEVKVSAIDLIVLISKA